jgi:hypothetical protein
MSCINVFSNFGKQYSSEVEFKKYVMYILRLFPCTVTRVHIHGIIMHFQLTNLNMHYVYILVLWTKIIQTVYIVILNS